MPGTQQECLQDEDEELFGALSPESCPGRPGVRYILPYGGKKRRRDTEVPNAHTHQENNKESGRQGVEDTPSHPKGKKHQTSTGTVPDVHKHHRECRQVEYEKRPDVYAVKSRRDASEERGSTWFLHLHGADGLCDPSTTVTASCMVVTPDHGTPEDCYLLTSSSLTDNGYRPNIHKCMPLGPCVKIEKAIWLAGVDAVLVHVHIEMDVEGWRGDMSLPGTPLDIVQLGQKTEMDLGTIRGLHGVRVVVRRAGAKRLRTTLRVETHEDDDEGYDADNDTEDDKEDNKEDDKGDDKEDDKEDHDEENNEEDDDDKHRVTSFIIEIPSYGLYPGLDFKTHIYGADKKRSEILNGLDEGCFVHLSKSSAKKTSTARHDHDRRQTCCDGKFVQNPTILGIVTKVPHINSLEAGRSTAVRVCPMPPIVDSIREHFAAVRPPIKPGPMRRRVYDQWGGSWLERDSDDCVSGQVYIFSGC